MLVLTRRSGERILIGDNIWVTVVSVERGKVRLGIEAPPDVVVLRQELAENDHRLGHQAIASRALPTPTVVAAVRPKG
jgi:carbon storage regulator